MPVLSVEDHQHFIENGYVVVRHAVDAETIADVVAALDGTEFSGTVGRPDFKYERAVVLERCSTERYNAAIAEIFGETDVPTRPAGSCMPRVHEPEADWSAPPAHVDDDYPTAMPNGWALGTFLFLTRVRERGGGFYYYSGSPRRYRRMLSRFPHALKARAGESEFSGEGREFLAEPGDLLLFHHNFGHGGTTNVADPRTRQALLARHAPIARIVPGTKPFEEMTTIEKANSARFLRQRLGDDVATVEVFHSEAADTVFRDGIPFAAPLRSFAALYHNARIHLLAVTEDEPKVLLHRSSADWTQWKDEGSQTVVEYPIGHLQWYQQDGQMVLAVSGASVEGTRFFAATEPAGWKFVAHNKDVALGTPGYCSQFGSRVAVGKLVLGVDRQDETRVFCQWGQTWEAAIAAEADRRGVATETGTGRRVAGLEMKPVLGESLFGMTMDIEDAAGGAGAPYYTLSRDTALFKDSIQPLEFEGADAPRSIRVCLRAQKYWLVAYTMYGRSGDRVFWGTIDWDAERPRLEQISDAAGLERALGVVGGI